jgi:hypothetical protein
LAAHVHEPSTALHVPWPEQTLTPTTDPAHAISQCAPTKPIGHAHVPLPVRPSKHVAPFWHAHANSQSRP